jgi:hypothetical protein
MAVVRVTVPPPAISKTTLDIHRAVGVTVAIHAKASMPNVYIRCGGSGGNTLETTSVPCMILYVGKPLSITSEAIPVFNPDFFTVSALSYPAKRLYTEDSRPSLILVPKSFGPNNNDGLMENLVD